MQVWLRPWEWNFTCKEDMWQRRLRNPHQSLVVDTLPQKITREKRHLFLRHGQVDEWSSDWEISMTCQLGWSFHVLKSPWESASEVVRTVSSATRPDSLKRHNLLNWKLWQGRKVLEALTCVTKEPIEHQSARHTTKLHVHECKVNLPVQLALIALMPQNLRRQKVASRACRCTDGTRSHRTETWHYDHWNSSAKWHSNSRVFRDQISDQGGL